MGAITRSNLYLYASYTSTCLEDRAWSFCVSLCMTLLGGMQLVSIEQLAEGLTQIVLSGHLGKLVDRYSRKAAIRAIVPLNNLSIVAAAACFIVCLSVKNDSPVFTILLIMGMFFCSINRLFLNAEKFILGRDWVVVISNENLSDLNAILTTLDQFANVISPLITGGLVSICGLRTTCAIFGIGSLVSMSSKVLFLRLLYSREPALHSKKEEKLEQKTLVVHTSTCSKFMQGIKSIPHVFAIYYEQTIFAAALGMALLFMTVLGFDGLAVGYGQSIGLPEALLGGFRSFGSFMGIAGALSYAFFEKRLGVRKAGLLGLGSQQIFILMAVISIWLPGSPMDLQAYFSATTFDTWWDELKSSFKGNGNTTQIESHIDWKHFTADGNSMASIFVFLIGISCARFGLWMADLSIMHIMQEAIAESQRNTVFGVHNALCQTFSVIKDLLVIALPDPQTFAICILTSYVFVTTGHICYLYYLKKYPPGIPVRSVDDEPDDVSTKIGKDSKGKYGTFLGGGTEEEDLEETIQRF